MAQLGNPDYDYSCVVTAITGRKVANKIGNVTGTLGRAWNFAASQAERTFGYPQAAPFNGGILQTTASTDWYTHDFVSGSQISKIIGSDLTGGSSGGPWILGWTGGLAETVDTDASGVTDPEATGLMASIATSVAWLIATRLQPQQVAFSGKK